MPARLRETRPPRPTLAPAKRRLALALARRRLRLLALAWRRLLLALARRRLRLLALARRRLLALARRRLFALARRLLLALARRRLHAAKRTGKVLSVQVAARHANFALVAFVVAMALVHPIYWSPFFVVGVIGLARPTNVEDGLRW